MSDFLAPVVEMVQSPLYFYFCVLALLIGVFLGVRRRAIEPVIGAMITTLAPIAIASLVTP